MFVKVTDEAPDGPTVITCNGSITPLSTFCSKEDAIVPRRIM
jgi:hypothetical protein